MKPVINPAMNPPRKASINCVRKNGYLTVYLSLCLSLILSFVLTMLEGARLSAVRMKTECAADIGMNSVLAEYHRELLEQYELFFVDPSYGTAYPALEATEDHLRRYVEGNFRSLRGESAGTRDLLALTVDRVKITERCLAVDGAGAEMERQALSYMESSTVKGMLAGLVSHARQVDALELDTGEINNRWKNVQEQIHAVELPEEEDENGEWKPISLNNPADRVNSLRRPGLLQLVLEDASLLSGAAVDTQTCLSHRVDGFRPVPQLSASPQKELRRGRPLPGGPVARLLFTEYLLEKCGRYGDEKENSLLKYQIEYILAGKASDRENLESVAKRLLLWREAANILYILSDSGKCAEAEALALTLTAVLRVPILKEPVKYSILFAWAYIESLGDVKCLLQGGNVPLMKTAADWRTGIGKIMDFDGGVREGSDPGRGLAYEEYLGIMLYLQDRSTRNLRTMDLMEMDIRLTPGNRYFRMDVCFDAFTAEIATSSGFGYGTQVRKSYGYD